MNRPVVITAAVLSLGAALATTPASRINAQSATVATATATRTFAIANMTCALCPITVRKAMARVEGVRIVEVDFAAKTATVVFDPSATSPAAIAAASTHAGYPAAPDA
jgi:periplasmic mercuric ion binding protein